MKKLLGYALPAIYTIGVLGTFVFLTFLDDYKYTWWNWVFVVPLNAVISGLWPIYWLILRPIFGH